jgi:tetratricopeptide (TPR) repeat protein
MLNHQNLFRTFALSIMLCMIAVSGHARPLSFYQEYQINKIPKERDYNYKTLALYYAFRELRDQTAKALAILPEAKKLNISYENIIPYINEILPLSVDSAIDSSDKYNLSIAVTVESKVIFDYIEKLKNTPMIYNNLINNINEDNRKIKLIESFRIKLLENNKANNANNKIIKKYNASVLSLSDDLILYLSNTARNYKTFKRYDEAVRTYSAIIDVYKGLFSEPYLGRAIAKMSMGNDAKESALDDLNTAIKLAPGVPSAYEWRGSILMMDKKLNEAIADFTKAISLNPKAYWAYSQRSYALSQQNRKREALLDVNNAIELAPDTMKANNYMSRGSIKEELGEFNSALKDYETSLALGNKLAEPYVKTLKKKLNTFAALENSGKKKWQPHLRGYYDLKKFVIKYENGTTLTSNDMRVEGYIKFDDNNNFITVARLGNQEISLKGRSELRMIDDDNGLFVAVTDKGVEEGKVYFPDSEEFTLTYNKTVNGQSVVEIYTYSQKKEFN